MKSRMGSVALAMMSGLVLSVPLPLRRRPELATTIAVTAGLEVAPAMMMMMMTTMMKVALTAPVVVDTVPAIVAATAIAAAVVLARTPVPERWRLWALALLPLLLVWPWPTRSMENRAMTGAVARAIVVPVLVHASQE